MQTAACCSGDTHAGIVLYWCGACAAPARWATGVVGCWSRGEFAMTEKIHVLTTGPQGHSRARHFIVRGIAVAVSTMIPAYRPYCCDRGGHDIDFELLCGCATKSKPLLSGDAANERTRGPLGVRVAHDATVRAGLLLHERARAAGEDWRCRRCRAAGER